MELTGKRILVTGATGLLGGATVDQLVGRGEVTVRVFARDPKKLCRFDGHPVEVVIGDITDPVRVNEAVDGCDVVIHSVMAKGGADTRLVNVEGTRHVLDACMVADVERIVHVSSNAVYMPWPDGVVDETYRRVGDGSGTSYVDTKLESEELALQYHREKGLPVVVVQPSAVYGPRAPTWTVAVIDWLRHNTVIMVDGDQATHNFVYVDDEARGMILAAEAPSVEGELFLVCGGETIITRDFYAAYEEMLGVRSALSVTREQFEDAGRDLHRLAKTLGVPGDRPPVGSGFTTRTFFSNEKAWRLLGYEPQVSFAQGMELTESWCREVGLL
jgi:nucleoside-diphosphate-sugar epimerase